MRAENKAARAEHLDLMKKNNESTSSIAESFRIMAEKMK